MKFGLLHLYVLCAGAFPHNLAIQVRCCHSGKRISMTPIADDKTKPRGRTLQGVDGSDMAYALWGWVTEIGCIG